MARIDYYTCDFCGTKVENMVDLEPLTLQMDSETVHQTYKYYVCPWCAATFTQTTSKDLFLEHIRVNFVDEQD